MFTIERTAISHAIEYVSIDVYIYIYITTVVLPLNVSVLKLDCLYKQNHENHPI